MASFSVQIINHVTPALSVVVQERTVGGQDNTPQNSYSELKQSLGQQNFEVQGLYLFSENISQLTGVIQYSNFDVTGQQEITNIVTQIDPNQNVPALLVDLSGFGGSIILSGNSNIAATIQPQSEVQVKFLTKRLGGALGGNYDNFIEIQKLTGTKFFEDTYGYSLQEVKEANIQIAESISATPETPEIQEQGSIQQQIPNQEGETEKSNISKPKPFKFKTKDIWLPLLAIAVIGATYYLTKKDKK